MSSSFRRLKARFALTPMSGCRKLHLVDDSVEAKTMTPPQQASLFAGSLL
jgi:hypothetical protein